MMFRSIIFAIFLLKHGEGQLGCLPTYRMSIWQRELVNRPGGLVKLTCIITGNSLPEVELYTWMMDELSSPIYTYSDKHNITEIKGDWVRDETYRHHQDSVESTILMFLSLSDKHAYRCEFHMRGGSTCSKKTSVRFKDPIVSIHLDQETQPRFVGNTKVVQARVSCSVDAADGKPDMRLWYVGTKNDTFRISHQHTTYTDHGYYHQATHSAMMLLPVDGEVTCQVIDTRGTYTKRRSVILPAAPVKTQTNPGEEISMTWEPYVICLALVLGIYMTRKWWKRGVQWLLRRVPSSHEPVSTDDQREPSSRLLGKEIKWKHITELSDTPQLFKDGNPSTKDIRAGIIKGDGGFLAALYSLCVGYNVRKWDYFKNIFKDVSHLEPTEEKIPLYIWFTGEWTRVYIDKYLRTERGEHCFVHSDHKDVFWSALVRKACANWEPSPCAEWRANRMSYVLEDLTGGVSEYLSIDLLQWNHLNMWYRKGFPMTCRAKKCNRMRWYSITSVGENDDDHHFIQLREFSVVPQGNLVRMHRFPSKKKSKIITKDEFCLTPVMFRKNFEEICILYVDEIYIAWTDTALGLLGSFKGVWNEKSTDKKGMFWTNPQYLLQFDPAYLSPPNKKRIWYALWLALMQKAYSTAKFDSDGNQEQHELLDISYRIFEIIDDNFKPEFALTGLVNSIKHVYSPPWQKCREICGPWWSRAHSRYIIVPCNVRGSGEFLLRVFSENTDAMEIKLLPPSR